MRVCVFYHFQNTYEIISRAYTTDRHATILHLIYLTNNVMNMTVTYGKKNNLKTKQYPSSSFVRLPLNYNSAQ